MFDVSIRDFTKASAIVAPAIDKWSTIPALTAMKVHANGRLDLEGSNLDMVIRATIDCQTKTEATFLIENPRALVSAIGAAGGTMVTLEATEAGYRARAGKLNRSMTGAQPVKAWPANGCEIGSTEFSATIGADFIKQLERVAPAISTEETRYYLNGVFLVHLSDWSYRLVATDGHRLFAADVQLPDATGILQPVIMPAAFVRAMIKTFGKTSNPISFQVGSPRRSNAAPTDTAPDRSSAPRLALAGKISFGTFDADVSFNGKTIDGKFPDYGKVVPTAPKHQATFQVKELRQAVLAVAAGMKTPPCVSLSFGPDGVAVGMTCGVDGVTAAFHVGSVHNMPDGLKIGLRSTYALDLLAAFKGEEVSFATDDQASPILLRDPSDGAFLAVQMPMRV